MEKTATLIATFWNVKPFLPAVLKFAPRKVILLIAGPDDKSMEANLDAVRTTFKDTFALEKVRMPMDDIYEQAKKTVELIDREATPENLVVVSVGGGWKTLTNGVLYGCYARPQRVYRIVSNTKNLDGVIELPRLSYNLTPAKKAILMKVAGRGSKSIAEIASELHRSRAMTYAYLREMRDDGYVDESFAVTDAGKLALL
jgi:CRISPR locus-related DNA-binding protein